MKLDQEIRLLDRQIQLYSVDTSAFYNQGEQEIHVKMRPLYKERSRLKHDKKNNNAQEISELNSLLGRYKVALKDLLRGNKKVRTLNEGYVTDSRKVNVFVSFLTRTLQIDVDELTNDLLIVEMYYQDIIRDIIIDGFDWDGEHYIYFCASAGQIRKKLNVFIKESVYNQYKDTIMCGLSIEDINDQGGVCINKFIAYTALSNSATDEWVDFDIRRCIIVDDFETDVYGDVDYINWDNDCDIIRQTRFIPVPHMDGAGVMLPSVYDKNLIIRAPYIKGLLTPFDFVSFINEKGRSPVVTDIYGDEWNILTDNIEVIFTKSQFKMHSYYVNWDDYCTKFELYDGRMGVTGKDVDIFKNKRFNYQMLQTLHDMPRNDVAKLVVNNNYDIYRIGNDRDVTLRLLGSSDYNKRKNWLQKSINIYEPLAAEGHSREILRAKKTQLVKQGKSGKLKLGAKYTYIIPDVYAFAEWLFLGIQNPKGLLKDGEVYCDIFQDNKELDCLRSPHLYIEHAIRKNIKSDEASKWFITNGIYTSSHDLISTLLFFDCDGDIMLVCDHPIIIKHAKRLIQKYDVVPLHFERKKAKDELITGKNIVTSLFEAYRSGKIGIYSNYITKILNKPEITYEDINTIKVLVVIVNRIIDSAKNKDNFEIPPKYVAILREVDKLSLPYFFQYAKDKDVSTLDVENDSVCNMLDGLIKNPHFTFNGAIFGKYDYKMLMRNKNIDIDTELAGKIINMYHYLDRGKNFVLNSFHNEYNNYRSVYLNIKNEIATISSDESYVCDVLWEYLSTYRAKNKKTTFWECWGDVAYTNLKDNLDMVEHDRCVMCNKPYKKNAHNQKYCNQCRDLAKKHSSKKNYSRLGKKVVTCKQCEVEFEVRVDRSPKICTKCYQQNYRDGQKRLDEAKKFDNHDSKQF